MPKQAANSALVAANKVEDVWSKHVQFTMNDVTLVEYKAAMTRVKRVMTPWKPSAGN